MDVRTIMRRHAAKWAVVAVAPLASACNFAPMLMPGAAPPRVSEGDASQSAAVSSADARRWIDSAQPNLADCEAQTSASEAALRVVLEKATAPGAPTMGAAAAAVRDAGGVASLEVRGMPDLPLLALTDATTPDAQSARAPRAKRANGVAMVSMLRADVGAINDSTVASARSMNACLGYSQFATKQFGGMSNGGHDPTPEMFAVYATFLRANARSEQVASASLAMMGALQAAFAGTDPKVVDAVVDGAKRALESPIVVTDDQARGAYAIAADELVADCRSAMEGAYKARPDLVRPARDPCAPRARRSTRDMDATPSASTSTVGHPTDARLAKADAALGAAQSAADGDIDGTAASIRKLVPDGSPAAHALDGFKAVREGDAKGAIRSALKLAPSGPLTGAIDKALSLF